MHVQLLARNVTSKTHVRSSSGSSKLTHSWADCGPSVTVEPPRLVQQLARGQQALPELFHVHLLVGGVDAVVGQADAEEQHGRVEDAAQRFFGTAAAFPGEQRRRVP